jgi:hypothetical protein
MVHKCRFSRRGLTLLPSGYSCKIFGTVIFLILNFFFIKCLCVCWVRRHSWCRKNKRTHWNSQFSAGSSLLLPPPWSLSFQARTMKALTKNEGPQAPEHLNLQTKIELHSPALLVKAVVELKHCRTIVRSKQTSPRFSAGQAWCNCGHGHRNSPLI